MRVTDPGNGSWRVGRRWLPWRRRLRELPNAPFDLTLPDGDDPISSAIGLVLLAVGLIVLLPLLLLAVGLVLELVALLALVPVAAGIRIALRRPWTVQVIGPDGAVRHTERVVGWRSSGERVRQLAEQLRRAGTEGVLPG